MNSQDLIRKLYPMAGSGKQECMKASRPLDSTYFKFAMVEGKPKDFSGTMRFVIEFMQVPLNLFFSNEKAFCEPPLCFSTLRLFDGSFSKKISNYIMILNVFCTEGNHFFEFQGWPVSK